MKERNVIDMTLTLSAFVVGVAAIGYGLYLVYAPLAWVFGGLTCLVIASWPAPGSAPKRSAPK